MMLKQLVNKYGENNWDQIILCMEGRPRYQCERRWKKVLCPQIRHGKWTPEEDEALIEAVKRHGRNWMVVQQFVPGRTDVKCRERYINTLDPNIERGPWSEFEKEKLGEFIAIVGEKWAEVSRRLAEIGIKRTDNQCYREWGRIVKDGAVDSVSGKRKRLGSEDLLDVEEEGGEMPSAADAPLVSSSTTTTTTLSALISSTISLMNDEKEVTTTAQRRVRRRTNDVDVEAANRAKGDVTANQESSQLDTVDKSRHQKRKAFNSAVVNMCARLKLSNRANAKDKEPASFITPTYPSKPTMNAFGKLISHLNIDLVQGMYCYYLQELQGFIY